MDGNFSQQPQYNDFHNHPSGQGTNNTAIAALVCGIIGLIGIFIPIFVYIAVILSIIAIVYGARGMKDADRMGTGKGLAIAGLVLGIVSVSLFTINCLCLFICVGTIATLLG